MGAFTSDLSVDESLLADEVFEPVRFVMATCHWHVGWQWAGWSKNQEMDVLTRAMGDARHLAMQKIGAQLEEADADGVIGARITASHHEEHVEFVAIGTAVRARADRAGWRVNGKPFTSSFSGQDIHLLLQTGYRPRALVMGNCVYHVAHQTLGQWLSNSGMNQEMDSFTQALYDARELAMGRMQTEAEAAGADGIVGVKVHEGPYGWGSHVLEYFAIGTAVAKVGEGKPEVALRFDLAR